MRPYIEFKNVVKQFGNFTALDHVSLEIPKGAFVTLLGPSGCGKTTLMRQLAGFSEPESGDVLVDGKRMNGLPPFKRNTPLVFQEYALFPHMTVYENNMNLLYDKLIELGFSCVRPSGTFYIFPKALEEDAVAFCNKALKYDLVLVPSDSFGCPGYFRMAYCIDTEKVVRSLDALERFVKTEYPDR